MKPVAVRTEPLGFGPAAKARAVANEARRYHVGAVDFHRPRAISRSGVRVVRVSPAGSVVALMAGR